MKKLSLLALAALCLTGCWTSIRTVAPTETYETPVQTTYSTQVTYPSPRTTTTQTITVTSYNNDWSFYLDLQAVAAAFAESNSVQEFERLLNSNRYMINNLDLNRDGWIDYLRVLEVRQGYYHTFLIQACLAPNSFQDVATLVAERRSDRLYVELIGDRYLYGYNYIVRPVFIKRPPLWDHFGHPHYSPWSSPYYYGYWPSYYNQPKPVYLNHYQAYVNTYMHNHHYCHHCDYPPQPYWNGYTSATQSYHRNDYEVLHPDNSFERRVTNTRSGSTLRNAGQLREEVSRETQKAQQSQSTQSAQSTSTSGRQSQPTASQSSSSGRTSQPAQATTTTRTTQTSSTTRTSQPAKSSQTAPSTSVSTRVNKSGETRTTIKTTDASGRTQTVKRESSSNTQRSTGSSQRTSGSSSSSQRTSGTSSSSSQRTSGSSSSSQRTSGGTSSSTRATEPQRTQSSGSVRR